MLRKILFISAFISLLTVSCKKDFLDQNVDPNLPSTVPASEILPAALAGTASLMVDANLVYPNIWMGFWSFSPTYGIPTTERDYDYPNSSAASGYFANAYVNASSYQQIITAGVAQHNYAYQGIGRIMKSMVMQSLVDLYGDVPYSQAFLGTANTTPKYDKASAIYDSLYNQLTIAIANLHAAGGSTDFPGASSDIMFQGDSTLWIKLANTLKLKLLIRQAGVTAKASYIQAKLADFAPDLSDFLQAKDIAKINPGYTNSANKQNPFWANYGYSVTNTVTAGSDLDVYVGGINAVNMFAGQNDLRLARIMDYFSGPSTGTSVAGVDPAFYNSITTNQLFSVPAQFFFAGTEMGTAPVAATGFKLPGMSTITNNPSNMLNIKAANSDALIFSDFESLFLQAEAVQRGWFPSGDPQALLLSAQTQSFAYDFDGPLGQAGAGAAILSDINPTADNDWATAQSAGVDPIQLIITQKFMALATYNMMEPWTEYRRTGFPKVALSTNSSGHHIIPYRYLYPQREYSVNGTNVPVLNAGDQFTTAGKIFWMP